MRYFLFSLLTLTIFWSQQSDIVNSSKSKMCMHLANKLVGAVIQEEELHGGIPTIAKMELLSENIRSFNNFQIESGCESAFAYSTTSPYQNLLLTLKAIESAYAKELGKPLSIVTKNILPDIAL